VQIAREDEFSSRLSNRANFRWEEFLYITGETLGEKS
jgi:hypothetical protein